MAQATCLKRDADLIDDDGTAKKMKLESTSLPESQTDGLGSEFLQEKLALLVKTLNEDREQDQIIIDDMKTKYDALCTKQMERMNEKLQLAYETSKDPITDRMNILQEKLDNIRQLESDIEQFKSMLSKVHRDVTTQEDVE